MNFFAFQWHITDACDQRCRHCYIYADDNTRKAASASWEQMLHILANCEDFCRAYSRRPYFYLTGGDPILHPDFWRLLQLLWQKKIPFTIMGNPFHLDDAVCRELKSYGCHKYQQSLDGMRRTHDWFRKPGSFDLTLEKIGCLRRAGIRTVVMTTVSGRNVDELPDIVDTVVAAETDVFAFARYCPTGSSLEDDLTPERYRMLLETCDRKFQSHLTAGCKTYFNKKDHLWTLYEYETGNFVIPDQTENNMIYGGCNLGNCHLTILPTGDVMACRRVPGSQVGNALHDRLQELWTGPLEAYREYDRFEKCGRCELLAWCRGCPAVSSTRNGSFYAPDPQCWKVLPAPPAVRQVQNI